MYYIGTKLYRQTVGIPMGTNCAPLVADFFFFFFFFCYERDFMKSLSRKNQADIIEAFCLDLSVSSSSLGLGRAAVCDCGTPWTLLFPFFSIQLQDSLMIY